MIRRWSCILTSKQWKCLPHCSWLCLHWRRRRIKIRQKMWWELQLLSRVILSKFFPLSPQKTKHNKKQAAYIHFNFHFSPCVYPVEIWLNLCFTSWSANCRGCSSSAKKSRLCQGASDFLTRCLITPLLHKTLVYTKWLSELMVW